METTNVSLEVAEQLCRAHADEMAKDQVWRTKKILKDEADLNIFLSHLRGRKVLDVGCGWGHYAADLQNAGVDYLGIDHSPEMIKAARQLNPQASFRIMSFNNLQFPEESFSGLWCCCVFSTTPKTYLPSVLANLRRLLEPSGVMTVVMPYHDLSLEEMTVDPETEKSLFWYAIYETTEMCDLFILHGFTIIDVRVDEMNGAQSFLVRK
jgi:ubiquinone/menaquinone biosynthesis C-methylase UbiE